MTRRNFSQSVLTRRFQFAGGLCEWIDPETKVRCNAVLVPGRWHADHDNPDGLTGEPTFENCRALCLYHHALKTKQDVKAIAKAKRREAKAIGATRPAGKIVNRGFDPTAKSASRRDREPRAALPPRPMFVEK